MGIKTFVLKSLKFHINFDKTFKITSTQLSDCEIVACQEPVSGSNCSCINLSLGYAIVIIIVGKNECKSIALIINIIPHEAFSWSLF